MISTSETSETKEQPTIVSGEREILTGHEKQAGGESFSGPSDCKRVSAYYVFFG